MALFKILSGNSDSFSTDLTASTVTPPFNAGYCYFLKDTHELYVDWLEADNVTKRRTSLNDIDISSKVNRSGDTFTGPVLFNEVDGSCINYKNAIYINEEGGSTLLGSKKGEAAWVGTSTTALTFRGSGKYPTYMGNEVLIKNNFPNYTIITTSDIDEICGASIISASEVNF